MDGFGGPNLGLAFRVQSIGFGLADGPDNMSKGDIENCDTHVFMHWENMNLRASFSDDPYSMSFAINPRGITMMIDRTVNQWKVLVTEL